MRKDPVVLILPLKEAEKVYDFLSITVGFTKLEGHASKILVDDENRIPLDLLVKQLGEKIEKEKLARGPVKRFEKFHVLMAAMMLPPQTKELNPPEKGWAIRQVGCACSACGENVTESGQCWNNCSHNGEKPT